MPQTRDFSPVDPDESVALTFDFSDYLGQGVTIASAAVVCTLSPNSAVSDPTPSARVTASPSIQASLNPPIGTGLPAVCIVQTFAGGIAGVTYTVLAKATCSDGSIQSMWAHLFCNPVT